MNSSAAEQTTTGLPTTIWRLCRHDVVFVPAVFVALIGIVDIVSRPPAWVKRVPVAVSDLMSGERDNLADQLSKAETYVAHSQSSIANQRARLEALTAKTGELQTELSRQTAAREASEELVRHQQANIVALTEERDQLARELEAGSRSTASAQQLESKLAEAIREREPAKNRRGARGANRRPSPRTG